MHRVSTLSRIAVVRTIVAALAMPAYAEPRREDPGTKERIIKIMKRLLKSFGDGLIMPIP